MDADPAARIRAALDGTGPPDAATYPQRVCMVSARLLGMTGAGLSLTGATELGRAWSSDDLAQAIEELQLQLGEGPGVDAVSLGRPILEPDLEGPSSRWTFFRRTALELGVRAIFAFPLQVGAIDIGVLTLHRAVAGELSDGQLADALVLTDALTAGLLNLPSRGVLGWDHVDLDGRQARVHQATGMVSVQLQVSLADALVRLRAHAFAAGATVYDVAEQVVSRRFRFDERPPTAGG